MSTIYEFCGSLIEEKMYMLCEQDEILVVDAVKCLQAEQFLKEKRPGKLRIILTHEHIDHIYEVNDLCGKFECEILCSKKCAERIKNESQNLALYKEIVFQDKHNIYFDEHYTCKADKVFEGEYGWEWKGHRITMRETPGHSVGSICILVDEDILFTGDTLLKKDKIITTLPGGSRKAYEEETLPFLQGISSDVYVYPGHGESGCMREFVSMLE